jgi:two-component system KDP operon response regulator KdpE
MPNAGVTRNGVPMHLTPIEYKLLAVLIRNAGKVLTHRQLLKEVWGAEPGVGYRLRAD